MNMESGGKILNLYPIDYPFETLVTRIEKGKLKLDPDFQRKYKWDKDGWGRASKFIESCLMRIPLPSCYFAEDEGGNHMVIDGVQRLTTIQRYFDNGFPLEGMTTFSELEGKYFSELGAFQSELEATTIRCIILRKENPKKLVREIFSRLNQGAVELSDQEIRRAIYPGRLDELLMELGAHSEVARFGLGENSEVKRDSLEPEEQVLRFFAFVEDKNLESFGGLKEFLDSYMERNCDISSERATELRSVFNKAIDNCVEVFGKAVFTNPAVKRKRKGLIHYDLLMPTVGQLDSYVASERAEQIREAYDQLCRKPEFKKATGGGLQNKSSILARRILWDSLLTEALNER